MTKSEDGPEVDLAELARFDTPTMSNLIELCDIQPASSGYTDQRIQCCFPEMPPMVGYAATFTYRAAYPPAAGSSVKSVADLLETFRELPGPAIVVIQDLDEPPAAASFGELACSTYSAFGARGLISSGAGRDLDQVEAIGFPVFVGATICSHGYGHLTSVGKPVQVGGLTIQQGDLLHGDRNGVTIVPRQLAPHLPQAAREMIEAEKCLLEYVNGTDNPTLSGYREAVAAMGEAVAQVQERLAAVLGSR